MIIETKEAGVFIDDVKLQDLGIIVALSSSEPLLSAPNNRTVSIPNKHGAFYFGGHLSPIEFILNCTFNRSENYTSLKNRIADFKKMIIDRDGRPKMIKLLFEDESDRFYNVIFNDPIDIERLAQSGSFGLSLTCFDGHAWSALSNQDVTWGSEDIFFSNDTYTFGHSASAPDISGNGGEFNVVVVGDNVRPTITLEGEGNDVSVEWGDESFSLGTISGTTIVDLHEYVVLRNGTLALSTISGDWLSMKLTHGNANISVTGSNLDLTINVEFHDIFF